jgi:hypothetical protein
MRGLSPRPSVYKAAALHWHGMPTRAKPLLGRHSLPPPICPIVQRNRSGAVYFYASAIASSLMRGRISLSKTAELCFEEYCLSLRKFCARRKRFSAGKKMHKHQRCLLLAGLYLSISAPVNAQALSFDCAKARAADEIVICKTPELAELDNLVAIGCAYVKSTRGRQAADEVGIPLWNLRRACKSDSSCIRQRQVEAITAYHAAGAPVIPSDWVGPNGSSPQPAAALSSEPVSRDFIVDGLALGGAVYPESAVYKAYACRPSDDFAGFTWCARHRERPGRFGLYTSWVTLLHSSGNRVVFITQAIEPAFLGRATSIAKSNAYRLTSGRRRRSST